MSGEKILHRKLQTQLEQRERQQRLMQPPAPGMVNQLIDFGSNDTLSISTSRALTKGFLKQLASHPNFVVGSTSTRIFEGTTHYLNDIERDLARFHEAEAGLFFNSGFDANVALWSTVPRPDDVVVHDEYIHASIHDGMRRGRAKTRSFAHNDLQDFQRVLEDLRNHHAGVKDGQSVVFVAVESFYSMDGDVVPIREMLHISRAVFPRGNVVYSMDEAHSNGLIGPDGSGLVCHYGLEKEIGIRVHTCGKGLGSTGAVVLASETIRISMINYARNIVFSTAPSFITVAAVRAGYELAASEEGEKRRRRLQENTRYFQHMVTQHEQWAAVRDKGVIRIPGAEDWGSTSFETPIFALITPPGEENELADHIRGNGYWVDAVHYPIVPKQLGRVRLTVHADNTKAQIEGVVGVFMEWAGARVKRAGRKARL
ncbi:aminotransferase class I/II-fold pyridoxal phosphate-dependent enzyme [Aspergillus saccharolyticus JOP 1030-1]|uniref:PLP-dependent transferase n=1 Tax=Aspergillus saccharolyticus JOP 1030-1 TaxID=1450539 RepID=A0A318ZJU3_9EURO|nr:PLP-dependent transferase [Aspergillus saccharolyticus JOP 1030-1]PYH47075.1 PLP-dependent transferase [Aspergillus saccharolyticus JOP 1030-1]